MEEGAGVYGWKGVSVIFDGRCLFWTVCGGKVVSTLPA
jgi:hypothetical protein